MLECDEHDAQMQNRDLQGRRRLEKEEGWHGMPKIYNTMLTTREEENTTRDKIGSILYCDE